MSDFLVTYGPDESRRTPRGSGSRNVGIIGAPDAGSTTLTRRMEDTGVPVDEYHQISMILTNRIRRRVALAREYVATWEPRPREVEIRTR